MRIPLFITATDSPCTICNKPGFWLYWFDAGNKSICQGCDDALHQLEHYNSEPDCEDCNK